MTEIRASPSIRGVPGSITWGSKSTHGSASMSGLTRFEQLGVTHSPIAEREYGAVLTFKDPDGIQFEMFFKADHP